MNPTSLYVLYSTLVDSDIELEESVSDNELQLPLIHLCQGSHLPATKKLSFATPVLELHGRRACSYSDRPTDRIDPHQPWTMEIEEVVRFHWRIGENVIKYELLGQGTAQLLNFWLVHIFLPVYFTIERRYFFLHASAVNISGKVTAFLAPSRGGKSTLLKHMIDAGNILVSDDKLAFHIKEGCISVVPSHSRFRPYREFEDLGHRADFFDSKPSRLQAIFLLNRDSRYQSVATEPIAGSRKVDVVASSLLYGFCISASEKLSFLGKVANETPIFLLKMPNDVGRLDDARKAILQTLY